MNRFIRSLSCALALLSVALPAGCSGPPLSGPPSLRLGRDECAECGMLINEDRSPGAFLLDDAGRRRHVLFDDAGCLLDFERKNTEAMVIAAYVRDYETRDWLDANAAHFVLADPDRLPTPMGSGIAAFGDATRAQAAHEKFGGDIMDYATLIPARKAWMATRYGGSP